MSVRAAQTPTRTIPFGCTGCLAIVLVPALLIWGFIFLINLPARHLVRENVASLFGDVKPKTFIWSSGTAGKGTYARYTARFKGSQEVLVDVTWHPARPGATFWNNEGETCNDLLGRLGQTVIEEATYQAGERRSVLMRSIDRTDYCISYAR